MQDCDGVKGTALRLRLCSYGTIRGMETPVLDCVDENVSTKVVKIIQSYTGIVNKMVWRKV